MQQVNASWINTCSKISDTAPWNLTFAPCILHITRSKGLRNRYQNTLQRKRLKEVWAMKWWFEWIIWYREHLLMTTTRSESSCFGSTLLNYEIKSPTAIRFIKSRSENCKNYMQLNPIHVIRHNFVGTYRYWAPKYESRPTDRNSWYIWIPIFRFCQKLKLVFRSPQSLALSKVTTGSGNRTLLVFRNRYVYVSIEKCK